MRFTTKETCPGIVANMKLRDSDILEIAATSGLSPDEAIRRSIEVSSEWKAAISDTGEVLAVFGVAPVYIGLPGIGSPWFLATDAAEKHNVAIFRKAREWLEEVNNKYPVLVNFVDVRHKAALQWVTWLGFDLIQDQTQGLNGEVLIQIIKTKGDPICATL